ncbi:hypothetical protein B296_00048450 [Ensete ventricosum]|uniref:EDR1/CTR1/ARMC3-like peptidase-like domain-containing protein n=1 Tax=Ensete ventricosum TaxID=4639 RepID=A0A426YUR7_ENSVE|nr:hypothetical protein B296_00048450 [Ensete ventricosum]
MKHIFKIKRHPHRSNEIPAPAAAAASSSSPSPLLSTSTVSPSCASDHRAAASPMPPSPSEPPRSAAAADDRQDYLSSEEEFQMQLALAISASNSEFRGDLDGDQIRAAKLLSLGRDRIEQGREEGTAESLSRRYWVLADNVGIPCRLVKGSHYTGVDDDAVNIIKLAERFVLMLFYHS